MDQQAPNGADFMVQPGGGQDTVQNGITIAAGSGGSGTPVNGTGGGSTPGSTGKQSYVWYTLQYEYIGGSVRSKLGLYQFLIRRISKNLLI